MYTLGYLRWRGIIIPLSHLAMNYIYNGEVDQSQAKVRSPLYFMRILTRKKKGGRGNMSG